MDPATAAGLGLSVTSLALQLLGGCIKGYEIFLAMSEMPTQYEHLRIRMSLEQSRLLHWGEKVGLLEETLEKTSLTLQLHRNIIIDILSEIQRLFNDCLKIQAKFEDTAAHKNARQPFQITARPLLHRAIRAWDKTVDLPTRLQWAAIKQEKFEGLVEKLISYNDSIVSLLDRTTIQQIHDNQLLSQLTLLQLTNKVDDLQQLMLATQLKTNTQRNISLDQTHSGRNILQDQVVNQGIAHLASFKARQMSIERNSFVTGNGCIQRESVQIIEEIGTRSLATYRDERNWIEWKEYDIDSQRSTQEVTESRVQKLANLLQIRDTPREFRAPLCIGYIHDLDEDAARYGLMYSISPGTPEARPIALLDLFQERPRPSLTSRIELAHAMSRSLLYLHSVNWLHKGIRSENILFLVSPGASPWYGMPILSGFEYARPDLPEEQTEKPANNFQHDLYRHRDSLGHPDVRSKKSWDVYSLGIVLIEIALWKSIGEVLDLVEGQKKAYSRLRKVRDMVSTEEFLSRIHGEVGDIYEDVVRRCITGGSSIGIPDEADESVPQVAAEMQQAMSELVVGQLQSIRV